MKGVEKSTGHNWIEDGKGGGQRREGETQGGKTERTGVEKRGDKGGKEGERE